MSEEEKSSKKVARKRVVKKGVRGTRAPRKKTLVKKEVEGAEDSGSTGDEVSHDGGEVAYSLGASEPATPEKEIAVGEESPEVSQEEESSKGDKNADKNSGRTKKGSKNRGEKSNSEKDADEESTGEEGDEKGDGRNRRGRNRRGGSRERDESGPKRVPVDKDEAAAKAWEIYQGELEEEGVSLVDPRRARDVARRCLELATIFCEERDKYLGR